ncbi:hypothetical protein YC2023_075677 [Brassica napus]
MKKVFIPTYKVSKEKAESLGVEFVPLEYDLFYGNGEIADSKTHKMTFKM